MTPGRIFKVMFVLCVSFTQWSISISQCPKQFCTCTGKRVACVKHERHLRFIPSLPKHTEVLVFTGNFLPIISQETFRNISGLRLRELSLGGNKIRNISSDAFEVLKSLIFLDLSGNQFPVSILQESFHGLRHSKLKKLYLIEMALPDLPSDMFKHLQNVSTLHGISLNFNKLQNFVGSVFSVLKGLRYIGLNNNSITNVDFRGSNVEVIRFRSNKLKQVPVFCDETGRPLAPSLRVLDLGDNHISEINKLQFRGSCLPKLRNLTLDGNYFRTVPNNTFSDLPSLVRLSIKYLLSYKIVFETTCFNSSSLRLLYIANHMDMFPDQPVSLTPSSDYKNIFRFCRGLNVLDMTRIRLTTNDGVKLYELLRHLTNLTKLVLQSTSVLTLPEHLFSRMPFLAALHLDHCLLSQWRKGVFQNVSSIKTLYLDHNGIAIINQTSFPPELLRSLKNLSLFSNPFLCTCDLVWFSQWIKNNSKVLFLWPYNYKCKSPKEWAGKFLSEFSLSYSYCHPLSPYVIAAAATGAALALLFLVGGVLYRYRWHLKYYIYLMRAKKRGYEALSGDDDFIYDVFVAYHSDDRVWVISELIPCLEKKEKLRLCLQDRDFEVGKLIVDNITEKIHGSRKVLLLLSNNFIQSQWCKFEMTMAHGRSVEEDRTSSLVVVVLGNIDTQNMCNSLHVLLKTTSFMEWSNEKSAKELFWKRLVASIKP